MFPLGNFLLCILLQTFMMKLKVRKKLCIFCNHICDINFSPKATAIITTLEVSLVIGTKQ